MARALNTEIRRQILETAYKLFIENGYENVLTKEIAKECGITPALLQHYFSKKEDLLVHIVYNVVFRTSEYLTLHNDILIDFPDDMTGHIWNGLYYRLFYSFLSKDNYRWLRLYTGVLFNAQLLKVGLEISIDRIKDVEIRPSSSNLTESANVYLLNGFLSQLIAIYWHNNTLIVPVKDIVNTALSAFYRFSELSKRQEAQVFRILDNLLDDELIMSYVQHIEENITNYILL